MCIFSQHANCLSMPSFTYFKESSSTYPVTVELYMNRTLCSVVLFRIWIRWRAVFGIGCLFFGWKSREYSAIYMFAIIVVYTYAYVCGYSYKGSCKENTALFSNVIFIHNIWLLWCTYPVRTISHISNHIHFCTYLYIYLWGDSIQIHEICFYTQRQIPSL